MRTSTRLIRTATFDEMKNKYCCDSSRDMYYDFFTKQRGAGMPVFVGARRQRGHGIGNVLSGLFRGAIGLLGKGATQLLKRNKDAAISNLIQTGLNVAGDLARGKKVKETLKRRVPEGIKQTVRNIDWHLDDETPTRREPKKKKKKKIGRVRRQLDIFA